MHREDFPMLKQDIVYFDNGATSLKPQKMIDAIVDYYSNHTANIHRGDYDAAIKTDKLYDEARGIVAEFIHAKSPREVIFTSGMTDSMNRIVFGFMKYQLKRGDEVLISKAEHASNVLPWYVLQKELGIVVKEVPLDENHELTTETLSSSITDKTKVISLAHITNVIGDVRDVVSIGSLAKEKNIYFVVDAAQSVGHVDVNAMAMEADFLVFSGHKMLGPTGVGVLYGREDLLEKMQPMNYGGGMNEYFESDGSYQVREVPTRFEAGTPPIAEVIGLSAAVQYINKIGIENIHRHELELKKYLVSELSKIDNIVLYNKSSESGILAFNIRGVFSQDAAVYLNHYHIYIRAGNHCSKMLKDDLNIKNTCRISMHLYNNREDIDKLVEVLKQSEDIFKIIL